MGTRRHPLALLVLVFVLLAVPARALAAAGDPIVLGDDSKGTVGLFHKAIYRVADGAPTEQITAGNALPVASAFAFTGPETLVTVSLNTLSRVNVASGQVATVAASGAGDMRGVALGPEGALFVTDLGPKGDETADGRVLRLDPATGASTVIASGGLLVNPLGIAVGEDGTIYVTNSDGKGKGQVIAIDPTTHAQRLLTPPSSSLLVAPWGIAFLPNGELVVADESYNHAFRGALVRIDPTTGTETARLLEHLNGPIENATAVAVDGAGEVLVSERNSGQIDRVNLTTGAAAQVGQSVTSPIGLATEPGIGPTTTVLSGPSGTTNRTTPTFTFAPSQYGAHSTCAIDAGAPAPCTRTFTSAELTPGTHAFEVSSTVLGTQGPTAIRNFNVDPTAPNTRIDSGPSGPTNIAQPTFTFDAPGGGTSFTCSIDGGPRIACASPFEVPARLAEEPHSFNVRAEGDDTGDTRLFTVDTVAPDTSILSGPGEGASTSATRPTFIFDSSESPSTFACTLDGASVPCSSSFEPQTALGDGEHTLTVAATDAAGNADPTPVTRHFFVDTVAPLTTITSGPSGTTGEAAPTFAFSASEGGVFFQCSIDSPTLVDCPNPFTVAPALADGDHTLLVRAVDAAGNPGPTVERDFTVDADLPEASITAGPSGLINRSTVSFEFQSTKPNSSFECTLDSTAPAPCQSPFEATSLADRPHTFSVAATDAQGNTDPTAATRSFTVDTTPPVTTLGAGPGPFTNNRTPEFHFSSEPGATFSCEIDGGAAAPCTSPFTAPSLAEGHHTLTITATDSAGNEEVNAPQFSFTVDTVAPQTTLLGGPGTLTKDPTPSFAFSSEQGATFSCKIDNGPAVACTSPFTAPTLADDSHTLTVTATDQAGNVEVAPPQFSFTVDTTPPQPRIDSGPSGDTTDRRPTFTFSANEKSVFGCSLDGGAMVDCEGTFQPAAPLALGTHTFEVIAADPAGNLNETPAVRSFRVIPEEPKKEPPPTEHQPVSPGLSLTASLHGRALKVRVSAAPAATGSVAIAVTGRLGHKQLHRHLNLTLRAGLASGSLHLPTGLSKVQVTAGYVGDANYLPASATQTARSHSG
jgi:hypothetical protein